MATSRDGRRATSDARWQVVAKRRGVDSSRLTTAVCWLRTDSRRLVALWHRGFIAKVNIKRKSHGCSSWALWAGSTNACENFTFKSQLYVHLSTYIPYMQTYLCTFICINTYLLGYLHDTTASTMSVVPTMRRRKATLGQLRQQISCYLQHSTYYIRTYICTFIHMTTTRML